MAADLATLTSETFLPLVGQPFCLHHSADFDASLTLTAVREWGPEPGADSRLTRRPFTLTFSGPVEWSFQQGTVLLQHPAIGDLEIFMVPIQPNAQGRLYEAVFS